jgi:hypothetical protein
MASEQLFRDPLTSSANTRFILQPVATRNPSPFGKLTPQFPMEPITTPVMMIQPQSSQQDIFDERTVGGHKPPQPDAMRVEPSPIPKRGLSGFFLQWFEGNRKPAQPPKIELTEEELATPAADALDTLAAVPQSGVFRKDDPGWLTRLLPKIKKFELGPRPPAIIEAPAMIDITQGRLPQPILKTAAAQTAPAAEASTAPNPFAKTTAIPKKATDLNEFQEADPAVRFQMIQYRQTTNHLNSLVERYFQEQSSV